MFCLKQVLGSLLVICLVGPVVAVPQTANFDGWEVSFDLGLKRPLYSHSGSTSLALVYPYLSIKMDEFDDSNGGMYGSSNVDSETRYPILCEEYFADYDSVNVSEPTIDGRKGLMLHGTDSVLEEGYIVEFWIDEDSEIWPPKRVLIEAFDPVHEYVWPLISTLHMERPPGGVLNNDAVNVQNVTLGPYSVSFVFNGSLVGYTTETGTGSTYNVTRKPSRFGTSSSAYHVNNKFYTLTTEDSDLDITITEHENYLNIYRDDWEGHITSHTSMPVDEIEVDGCTALMADRSSFSYPRFSVEYWLDGYNITQCLSDEYAVARGLTRVTINSLYPWDEITLPLLESFHIEDSRDSGNT